MDAGLAAHPEVVTPPAVRVFFDTEFSAFRDGRLLSVGLIAEDGRERHVELRRDGAASKSAVLASYESGAPLAEHHALADARALRAGWMARDA